MESKEMKMDLGGREFKITNAPISTYASGYAIVSLGDTVIMANVTVSPKGKEGAAWFPMFVDYLENMYAAGKIKGSRFVKREGRPSENSVLISRLIDRPLRPLFPKGTINEVQIICTALAVDLEVDPGTTAINAASTALMLSGAPVETAIGAVRVGYVNDELILNPTYEQVKEGKLNLVVAGSLDAITMVEAAADEVPEEVIIKALEFAHVEIKKICQMQFDYVKQFEIKPIELSIQKPDEELVAKITSLVSQEQLDSIKGPTKMVVKEVIHGIEEQLFESLAAEIEEGTVSKGTIADILNKLMEKNMRKNILEKEVRLDGRSLKDVRQISVFPDVLPRVHGSVLFQRGETMALTVTTLGGPGAAQILDTMDMDTEKRYFHHYNFPPFATGDIKPLRGANRREIGHGDLGERALIPVLPEMKDFSYTMHLVSEIVRCNGSSSMASVCGSTLSLMAAGVPIKRPVSGIAMGLVSNDETGDYKILSDIQGMEDFAGDMDFKVTGTTEGITALQMDIKVKGLSLNLLTEALQQAKEGRQFILDKMLEVIPEVRPEMSKFAPLIMNIEIDPEMIRVVIGKGGETIQKITKECEVEMDIADEGIVTITAPDQERGKKAIEWVKRLTYVPNVGEVFENATVVKIMDFGAFVEFLPGKEGLVHISEMANERVNNVTDVVKEGDKVNVKLIKIDDQGRNNLSMKALLGSGDKPAAPKPAAPKAPAPKAEAPKEEEDGPTASKGDNGELVEGTSAIRKV